MATLDFFYYIAIILGVFVLAYILFVILSSLHLGFIKYKIYKIFAEKINKNASEPTQLFVDLYRELDGYSLPFPLTLISGFIFFLKTYVSKENIRYDGNEALEKVFRKYVSEAIKAYYSGRTGEALKLAIRANTLLLLVHKENGKEEGIPKLKLLD